MEKLFIIVLFLMAGVSWGQESGLDNDAFSSCSLFIKAKVFAPDFDETEGRALITATLTTTGGLPIPNREINMTVTSGTQQRGPIVLYYRCRRQNASIRRARSDQ